MGLAAALRLPLLPCGVHFIDLAKRLDEHVRVMREAEAIIAICRCQLAGAYEGSFVVACNTRAVDGAHHLVPLTESEMSQVTGWPCPAAFTGPQSELISALAIWRKSRGLPPESAFISADHPLMNSHFADRTAVCAQPLFRISYGLQSILEPTA